MPHQIAIGVVRGAAQLTGAFLRALFGGARAGARAAAGGARGAAGLELRMRGFRRLQKALKQTEQAVSVEGPGGKRGLRWAVTQVGGEVHKYARATTHIDTGALALSHRMKVTGRGRIARALIFIDPGALNPLGQRPAEYGIYEHGRGGLHAFYARTFFFFKRDRGARFIKFIRQQLP